MLLRKSISGRREPIAAICTYVTANIGKSSTDAARYGRARSLIRFTSVNTVWDSTASADISHGAHGTT